VRNAVSAMVPFRVCPRSTTKSCSSCRSPTARLAR
jgi:hypothetical protein